MKLNLKKNELDYFFIKNSFKKIFVITGKNSYFRSTADKISCTRHRLRSSGTRRPESAADSATHPCKRRSATVLHPRTVPGKTAGRSVPQTPVRPTSG